MEEGKRYQDIRIFRNLIHFCFPYFIFCLLWLGITEIVKVAQSCLTLCDFMDCSPPGSSVLGILQAKMLEKVATSFSRGSPWSPRAWTLVSCIASRFFTIWATREAHKEVQKWTKMHQLRMSLWENLWTVSRPFLAWLMWMGCQRIRS